MALTLKEITISKKVTINLSDYSNEVIEITLTTVSDAATPEAMAADIALTDSMANEALINAVIEPVTNRLIAGLPALNGKVGNNRRIAIESQPCVKVLATLNPELARQTVDHVLELSLAPLRNEEE